MWRAPDCAQVYCIRHLRHGQKFACKTLGKKKLLSQLDAEDIKREIEVRPQRPPAAGRGRQQRAPPLHGCVHVRPHPPTHGSTPASMGAFAARWGLRSPS